MKRHNYGLNHLSATCGQVGRLQTLSCVPIIAGDSIEARLSGNFNLSPHRKNVLLDGRWDIYVFFVPHRICFDGQYSGPDRDTWQPGTRWKNFIEDKSLETATFATETFTGNEPMFLGTHARPSGADYVVPEWRLQGYNLIYNRYFRDIDRDDNEWAYNVNAKDKPSSTNESAHRFGRRTCHLPMRPFTAIKSNISNSVVNGQGAFANQTVVDIEKAQADYHSQVDSEYFGDRYAEVLRNAFGSGYRDDDSDPVLLKSFRQWVSGQNVIGSDDASLGQLTGMTATELDLHFPRRSFREHGTLWIMGVFRYAPVLNNGIHYFDYDTNPSYVDFTGDPQLLHAQEPKQYASQHFVKDGNANILGTLPHGWWLREQPDYIHNFYSRFDGYPFLDGLPQSVADSNNYIRPEEYNQVFASMQFGHWQSQMEIAMEAYRVVPPAVTSLKAGV